MRWDEYQRSEGRYGEGFDRDARVPGAAPRGRAEYGLDRPNWGSARSDYGRHAYGGLDERGIALERGFFERAGDEVRTWFGDEEAERRRRMDAREEERRERARRWSDSRREGTQMWSDMLTRDVMTRDVVIVRADDTAEHAARLMFECNCGAIPVVDRQGRVAGMVTDRDITVRLVARGADIRRARVEDCMTGEIFFCNEYDAIEDCMRTMSRHQVRRLPIVDNQDRIVGIISQSDLARHAGEHPGTGERRAIANVLCAVSEPTFRPYR